MNIGYVLKKYPRLSETFILNELLELERRGHNVTVFSIHRPDDGLFHPGVCEFKGSVVYMPDPKAASMARTLGAHIDLFRSRRDEIFEVLAELLDEHPDNPWPRLRWGVLLAIEAQRRGIEHLHAHFATVATQVARVAHAITGQPYSFTCHAKDIYRDTVNPKAFQRLVRDASFAVTVCDANQAHVREKLLRGTTLDVKRLYNGVDLNVFHPDARDAPHVTEATPQIVLGVGRLVEKKGFHVLIRASARLAKAHPKLRVLIVGEGEERERLEKLTEETGATNVELLGARTHDEVRDLLSQATLTALPCTVGNDGNRDALPTILLEALAAGLPVVSTPVAGVEEILAGGDAGVIVPCDDVASLSAAISSLLRDDERRRQLAENGRRRAEAEFDLRRNVGRLAALFAERQPVGAAGVAP